MWVPLLLVVLAGVVGPALGQADSREECDLTFSIPADQLQQLCQRTGRTPESLVQGVQADFQALKKENADLKGEIEALRAEYSDVVETVKMLRSETAVWREVVEWAPQMDQAFKPRNDSLVFHDDPAYADCAEAHQRGERQAGVYAIKPENAVESFFAFCEDGWTIIHRRYDGTTDFYEDWDGYTAGFGDKFEEFWLGLENMHMLTAQKDYKLKVEALGWSGKLYNAIYPEFYVSGEGDNYALSIGNMTSGNYEDVMSRLNGLPFTTHNHDNDEWHNGNCAAYYHGGWWLHNCGFDPNRYWCDGRGCMTWGERPVKKFVMKVRPMRG